MVALVLLGAGARATESPLRVGTLVPDGTAWARELKAFAREADEAAGVKVKLYWGGIAGDEHEMLARVRRGQLDAVAAAAMCSELAPSLKVARLQGLFTSRDEHERLLRQIPGVADEFKKSGFFSLGVAGMGPSIVFTREPVTSWEELKKLRLWRWDLDPVAWRQDALMGLTVVPGSVEGAAAAFDAGKVDGFVALAASALAFQWQSRAPHILPLELDYFDACFLIAQPAWDALSIDEQKALQAAGAKLQRRMELVGRDTDRIVLSGALSRGVRAHPVPAATRDAFFREAKRTQARAQAELSVPAAALEFVVQHLTR